VCEVAGARPDFVFKDLPVGDPTRRRPDISRARDLLGWAPTVELREGLERTHSWYLEERARGHA
jgi:UDP-glucuronate decarboxylase